MLVRWIALALSLFSRHPVESPPATATFQYRIEQRSESRIDLSVFGAPEQVHNTAHAWYVTVSYTDSAGGAALVATLDSLQVDLGTNPVTKESIDSAAGTIYRGFVDARRKIQSITASKNSTFGAQFESVLHSFHPAFKADAKTGDTWVDTLNVKLDTPSIKTTSQSIRNYSLTGTEARSGVEAFRVEVTFTETSSGTLDTPGGPAELEGTTQGRGTAFFGPGGQYLGGESGSTSEGNITIATAPSAIPIKTTTNTTVTLVR